MADTPTGFLVQQRDDGFGDVVPLIPGQRYTLGRAPSNRVVLRDDLCSRQHAEVAASRNGWAVRDLASLNGTAVNDQPAKGEVPLRPNDSVRMGRSVYLFVASLDQLPEPPAGQPKKVDKTDKLAITRRLGQTKYLPPAGPPADPAQLQPTLTAEDNDTVHLPAARVPPAEALAVLYRLAFDMAEASTHAELAEKVIDALFQATPAEVGAVLTLSDAKELDPVAYRTKLPFHTPYHKVSQFVSREVLSTRQAVLAADVAGRSDLRNRESLTDLRATSLICAPIEAEGSCSACSTCTGPAATCN
ncbi:MAG: FHA domain-containing protein [Gemmataceae bacterium]